MADKELENIVKTEDRKDIRLGRIALTTLGYGVVGAFFDDATVIAPLTAAVGLGASMYDEFKQNGMNLVRPAAGIFVGGLLGSLFDINANEYVPNILSYGGAALGGGLGFYKSYISRDKPQE
jgi:hypothetical protein